MEGLRNVTRVLGLGAATWNNCPTMRPLDSPSLRTPSDEWRGVRQLETRFWCSGKSNPSVCDSLFFEPLLDASSRNVPFNCSSTGLRSHLHVEFNTLGLGYCNLSFRCWLNPSRQARNKNIPFDYDSQSGIGCD
jgi:hypothetical protein